MLDILLGSEYASVIRFISFLDAILLYLFHMKRGRTSEKQSICWDFNTNLGGG